MAGFQNNMGVVLIPQIVTSIARHGRQSVTTKAETPVKASLVDFT